MFIAKDMDGNNVTIEEAELFANENPGIKREYFCPSCKNQVFVKALKSDKVRTHFAHTKECSDDWKYDMSEWHRNWQNCFPKECQEVVMENAQGEIHRADVCINNFVIEFQHSTITAEEIESRNIFYTALGYHIVWVFDASNKLKDSGNVLFDENYPITRLTVGKSYVNWKSKNSLLEKYKSTNVDIYLETKCSDFIMLILTPSLTEKKMERFIGYPPILKENFLKQYGLIDSDDIPSITDIINNTEQIIKNQPKNYIYRSPIRRRRRF